MPIQGVDFEVELRANMPRGFVFITGSERCLLSHPDSISSEWFINIQSCLLDCLWPCILNDYTGPALQLSPLILAQSLYTVPCLAPGMPSHQGDFPHLYQTGVLLGLSSRRKVVRTDASNSGLGALCEGKVALSSWSSLEQRLYISCLV